MAGAGADVEAVEGVGIDALGELGGLVCPGGVGGLGMLG